MQTSITTSELPITGMTQLTPGRIWRPSRTFDLGLTSSSVISSVQQLKTAPQSTSATQGVPQPLQNAQITRVRVGANVKVRVAFTNNPADPNFKGAQVVLQQGGAAPATVASSTMSPITFTVPRSAAPTAATVQSVGSLGNAPISQSPGGRLSLL